MTVVVAFLIGASHKITFAGLISFQSLPYLAGESSLITILTCHSHSTEIIFNELSHSFHIFHTVPFVFNLVFLLAFIFFNCISLSFLNFFIASLSIESLILLASAILSSILFVVNKSSTLLACSRIFFSCASVLIFFGSKTIKSLQSIAESYHHFMNISILSFQLIALVATGFLLNVSSLSA
jgi:hypothetical protein